jgi:pimeloyl-ACP methyl ester carboxylesterase
VWRHWWQALSRRHTLVRYDERGCGLSDWDVDIDAYSLDAWVRDPETVVDALGLERFPLLGISQGGRSPSPTRLATLNASATSSSTARARERRGRRRPKNIVVSWPRWAS